MVQTVSLPLGTAAEPSADIPVASGAEAVVGIYAAPGSNINAAGSSYFCDVVLVTPGEPIRVTRLDSSKPTTKVAGPGTFRVLRSPALVSIGVFSEV
ncbi:hypothetical protein SAMN05216229_12315 [Geopseudomonas sagittaria]|uniref:Uncharacterized protein n=1 Tax=Geopseudomonas sagittaria TaxID=1135990 RepID=A0A1I5YPA6_9GAMM|nr:hypothetical protein [Pseudomonas sagittaria]SFQ45925.1 hypothetical protein SAMN05216229_12315 [Pseudomonas sagittaria]